MRIKKFLSAKCPVCSGICLSFVRRRRLYCCFAVVGGEAVRAEHGLNCWWFFWTASRRLPPPSSSSSSSWWWWWWCQLCKVFQIRRTVTTSLAAAKECFNTVDIWAHGLTVHQLWASCDDPVLSYDVHSLAAVKAMSSDHRNVATCYKDLSISAIFCVHKDEYLNCRNCVAVQS